MVGQRWTLLALIGVGGSAAVYEATHRNGKRVAVKILRPEWGADPRRRKRFLREGYVANQVGHRAVVSIDDDGEEPDGTAYLVMEHLEGETLEQLAERHGGRVPWQRTVSLCGQLLEVLVCAHRRGIVHRDIKPGNLFVSSSGELRVLDFGLARLFDTPDDGGSVSQDGVLVGTPAFMAPEQARASLAAVGPQSDLWAAAATAFTLLTGRRVYEAPSREEQLALASVTSAPVLAEIAPDVPLPVAQVLQRALEYEPEARWSSAEAMLDALRAAAREATLARPPADPTEPVQSLELPPRAQSRRRQARGSLVFGGLLLACAGLWGAFSWRLTPTRAAPSAPPPSMSVVSVGASALVPRPAPALPVASAAVASSAGRAASVSVSAPSRAHPAPAPTVTLATPVPRATAAGALESASAVPALPEVRAEPPSPRPPPPAASGLIDEPPF